MTNNTKESSLTAPSDRDLKNKWYPETSKEALTKEELTEAMKDLNVTSFVDKFPKVDRTYADPPIFNQTIGLISFVPAKDAVPNKDGVYGFVKMRGNYASELESQQRAEYLIRNVDSYHQIYHGYVGRPLPLCNDSKYSAEVSEIDIRKQIADNLSSSIKQKKMDEQQQINEIKEREEKLLQESKKEEIDPYDNYITLKVKKAQLSWTYLEHIKKLKEVKSIIIKTRDDIEELDKSHPDYNKTYYEKYMNARKDAGIKESEDHTKESFIKFLVEDAILPGIDDNSYILS
jgi:hypothetical protein